MPPWVCMPCAYYEAHDECWHGERDVKTGETLRCACMVCERREARPSPINDN